MTTLKFDGTEHEYRIASSQAGLATATAIPGIKSMNLSPNQNLRWVPDGQGSRLQVVKEGLFSCEGSLEKHYNEDAVLSSSAFADAVQAFTTTALSYRWIQQKNLTTSKTVQLKVKGKYNKSVPDVDGIAVETYDFSAEEVYTT